MVGKRTRLREPEILIMLLIKLPNFKKKGLRSDNLFFKGGAQKGQVKIKPFINNNSVEITTDDIGRGSEYIFI